MGRIVTADGRAAPSFSIADFARVLRSHRDVQGLGDWADENGFPQLVCEKLREMEAAEYDNLIEMAAKFEALFEKQEEK